MVGGSITRGESLVDHRGLVRTVTPFKADRLEYRKCQSAIQAVRTPTGYLSLLRELVEKSLDVPIKRITKQGALFGSESRTGHGNATFNAFQEESDAFFLDRLRRDLQRDSVFINVKVLRGNSGHGVSFG